jgi:hypothetical protein
MPEELNPPDEAEAEIRDGATPAGVITYREGDQEHQLASEILAEAALEWLADSGSVDLLHEEYDLEVCGICADWAHTTPPQIPLGRLCARPRSLGG